MLAPGESLSQFVENAVRATVAKRKHQALFDFALQRELDRNSDTGNLDILGKAVQTIKDGVAFLESSPFACRKVGSSAFVRELIIPFDRTGSVALLEIVDRATVIIGAVRHQRADDYN